ncbi:MAG: hypothetical protein N2037_02555 [Acidimicrobiales bacterium]|nr:hypothetical protein [Acidimicrobiales bacterium]
MTAVGVRRAAEDAPTDALAAARRWLFGEKWLFAVVVWIPFILILWRAVKFSWELPPYPADSWSYYELSRSFPGDPMHLHVFRAYITAEPYSASFPPLWPLVIAIVDGLTGAGFRSGQLAGVACYVIAAAFLDQAGRRWFAVRGLGPAILLVLFIFTPSLQEMVSSAPIGLTVMLVAALLMLMANPEPLSARQCSWLGVAGGLLMLTRFDTAAFVVLLPLVLVLLGCLRRKDLLRVYVTLALTLSPWIAYSLLRFRTPFASDNSRVAMAVPKTFVLDYWPDGVPTLLSDPGGWFNRVFGLTKQFWQMTLRVLDEAQTPGFLALITGFVVIVSVGLTKWSPAGRHRNLGPLLVDQLRTIVRHRGVQILAAVTVLQYLALGTALSTSGYLQPRYFVVTVLLIDLTLVAIVLAVPHKPPLGATFACLALLWLGYLRFYSMERTVPFIEGYPFTYAIGLPFDDVYALASCVTEEDRVLFARDAGEGYMFGAITDGKGAMEPSNWLRLTDEQRGRFFRDYRITRVFVSPAAIPMTSERMKVARQLATSAGIPPENVKEVCTAGLYTVGPL